ncbi:MAG: GNAT family N-acetyltransferase [Acidimicrobiia bacterium]|nr:GNAT family N-acetyltransferase [Acidimicrobiia bacterium]
MQVHTDWSSPSLTRSPVAPHTSVFSGPGYLACWWEHFGSGELQIVESDSAVVALERHPGGDVVFVGDEDLTDYHSPLGEGSGHLMEQYLAALPTGTAFRLDSLPAEAADELLDGLPGSTDRRQHEAAYRLSLPESFEIWLADLKKKERQELRRKHRRFSEGLGPPRLLVGTPDPVEVFVDLHRRASGDKGQFMTAERAAFFRDLAALPGARVDLVGGADEQPLAAAFGFQDDAAYYLYNSAYALGAAEFSPGMVMLWLLIGSAIDATLTIFDFLKGDETYKLRLGAEPRPLYVLEGTT